MAWRWGRGRGQKVDFKTRTRTAEAQAALSHANRRDYSPIWGFLQHKMKAARDFVPSRQFSRQSLTGFDLNAQVSPQVTSNQYTD